MKKSIVSITILMTMLIVISAFIAGCTSLAPSAPAAPAKTLSTIEPVEMVLQLSDVPVNFTLTDSYKRNASEMRSWSVDHGWKKGYETVYTKDGAKPQFIVQDISIYPTENISLVVPDTVSSYRNGSVEYNFTMEELPAPHVGDSSVALRFNDTTDLFDSYLIAFVKYDVYEEISTNGTATDYQMLEQLANTAAAKIH